MKVIILLILCLISIVSSFSLRDLFERSQMATYSDGHRLVEKQAGFYGGGIDEIGSVGNQVIVARQEGPHMFLDDNGIPVQQNL